MEPYHEEPETCEWKTSVTGVKDGKFVTLEQSYFYPQGGGQPFDTGALKTETGDEYPVIFVGKFGGQVSHQIEAEGKPPLETGATVTCSIDKERRSYLMRSHTAAHIVSALIRKESDALITGNQLSTEKVRIDFSVENYDPELFKRIILEANELIAKGGPVATEFLSQEEALKEPTLATLAKGLPAHEEIRVVEIGGLDRQACGGTHIADISEIGELEFLKAENKGVKNRRVYFRLVEK